MWQPFARRLTIVAGSKNCHHQDCVHDLEPGTTQMTLFVMLHGFQLAAGTLTAVAASVAQNQDIVH